MEWDIAISEHIIYEKNLSFSAITVQIIKLGKDYCIILKGGEKAHVGCAVLTVPRPSLKGDGNISVTSSVVNVTGHKEELLCRCLAEALARKKDAVVVCMGGFHMDDITEEQIKEVIEAVQELGKII